MRTPTTIMAIGIGGCLVLGLMMQHLLRVSTERNRPAVLDEIHRVFGARLDGPSKIRHVRSPDGLAVTLELHPMPGAFGTRLARDVGQFVWRANREANLRSVEVICIDGLGGDPVRVPVPRPVMPWRPAPAPDTTRVVPPAASGR